MQSHNRQGHLDKRVLLHLILAALFSFFFQPSGYGGDFVRLNLNPTVLATASLAGTPVDVAMDASGHIIAITSEGNVYSLAQNGSVLSSKTLTDAGTPVAVAMDDVGDIYVAKDNGTILRLNTGLTILTTQTVTGTPVDISADNTGIVYIATSSGGIFKRNSNLVALTDNTITGTPTAITVFSLGSLTGNVFVTTSGGTVYRLNTSLTTLASGTVTGTPIDIAGDDAGNVIVVASNGTLHKINTGITVLASRTLSGTLVGVDLDDAGHVAAANQAGMVFVVNTSLTNHTSVSTGIALSAVSVNLTGDIVGVGGTGTPLVPSASFSASNLAFGSVTAGTSSAHTFTVTNSGTAPLNISSASITTSSPAGVWVISPTIPPAITLSPNNSQTFTVNFHVPAGLTADVTYNASISLTTNDPAQTTYTITVTGTGHVPIPKACYSETSLSFGQVNRGSSTAQSFIITNCGDADLQIQTINLTSTSPAGVWSINPMVPPAITLSPSTSQTFTVTCSVPAGITSDVTYNGTFNVTTSDPSHAVQSIFVGGTGHVPYARIVIPSEYQMIDYRDVEIGYRFSRPLLIRNTGDLALSFQVSYLDPADLDLSQFQLDTSAGSFTIAPNSEKIFRQTFQPLSAGNKELILVIHDANDAAFSTQNITLRGTGTPPTPIDVSMVIDRSGSMSEYAGEIVKIEALRRAGTLFTELLRDGVDYLGLTKYNHTNSTILDLGPIASVRSTAQTRLSEINDSSGIKPYGTTSIGGAMRTASGQFVLSPDPSHKKVMIVLTDGMENTPPLINDIINGYDTYPGLFVEYPTLLTYSIGLGLPSNMNVDKLQAISNRGAGGFYLVTGNLEGLSLFNLENYYFKIFSDAIGYNMIIDPTFTVGLNQTLEVPIGIITDDREALFFFIGELPEQAYIFELVDPQNKVVTSSSMIGGMSVQVKKLNNWMFFRLKFPPPDVNTDYVGIWKFRVRIDDPSKWTQELSAMMKAQVKQSSQFGISGTHRMSITASVGSNYRLAASLLPGVVMVGEPIRIRAALTNAGWPSLQGNISVAITRPDGSVNTERLYDDGLHGDEGSGDGIFGLSYYGTKLRGVYQFTFTSMGITDRGETVTRQAALNHFVGIPKPDPEKPVCIPCKLLRTLMAVFLVLLVTMIIFLWRILKNRITR